MLFPPAFAAGAVVEHNPGSGNQADFPGALIGFQLQTQKLAIKIHTNEQVERLAGPEDLRHCDLLTASSEYDRLDGSEND